MKVALVVDSWTGYPSIVKEANFFDDHPKGEGHDRFRLVELQRLSLSMDEWYEWIPHPTLENAIIRVPKVKFNTAVLRSPGLSVASNLNNKVSEAALKTVIVSDYQADFLAERAKYDTKKNANITVGTGKTFASIGNGITGSSSGDAILIFATAAGFYTENVVVSGVLTLKGMIADQGVIIQNSSGTVVDCGSVGVGGSNVSNLTARGVGGTPTLGFFCSGVGIVLGYCRVQDVQFGFRTDGMTQHNGLAFDCTDSGVFTTNAQTKTHFVTAVDCATNGIRAGGTSNVNWCRCIANGTDYLFGGPLSMGNVSSDGTHPGVGGSGAATTADFTNYLGNDFSLNIATAVKLKGAPSFNTDITNGLRKTTGLDNDIWPGAFDPDLLFSAAPSTVATRPLAKYKVAIRDFFLNSSNLLNWIQSVDAGGTTAGRVIMGYSAISTPPDIITKGPKVFISTKSFSADNADTATLFVATVEIIAEIIWSMDHLDDVPFTVEENFIDLLVNEACGLGLALDSTLEGSIKSINVSDIELDDGTEGQGRRERRTVVEFLIVYPMPT